MNKVILIGRLTRDPVLRYTQGDNPIAITRFTLAVNRKFKKENDNQDADFISCISFGKQAEFIEKYFKQGSKIAIVGRIQTGSYTNNEGQKIYTTDVIIEEAEFVEKKSSNDVPEPVPENENGFMSIPEGFDEELPFN